MATPPLPPGFQLETSGMPPLPAGFQLEGNGQGQPVPGPQPFQATDNMSGLEQLLAMYGRGVSELGQGAKQLGLHAGQALGLADPSTVDAYDKSVKEEARLYEKDLGQKPGGSVLPMAAQIITTAPAGAEAAAVKGLPWLAQLASSVGLGSVMGAVQPVTDGDYGSTKAEQIGLGGAFGGGANALAKGVGRVIEAGMNPTATLLNPVLKRSNSTPFAKESEQLAQETGVALTPAQVSGSPSATMAENMARQSILSRSIANEGDKARVQQLKDYYDRILQGVSASDASPDIAGKQVQGAARNLVSSLEKMRSEAAAQDFGAVRSMTKGQASIEPTSTGTMLQQIVDENAGIGTPTGDALANFAKKQLQNVAPPKLTATDQAIVQQAGGADKLTGAALEQAEQVSPGITQRLTDTAKQMTQQTAPAQGNLDKLMQLRSYLSKVSSGQAKISGDNQDRRVAAQLLGSIDQDIDGASQQIGGDLGAALGKANARYKDFSQQIDSVHQSPLGGILGQDVAGAFQSGNFNTVAPEAVINKLSALKPSELGVVRGLMEQDQPQAWQAFKRSYLESALEKASQIPASEGANGAVMIPSKLVKSVGDQKKLEAIFSPAEVSQINAAVGVARRLSDKTGYNFSGTAPAQESLGLLNSLLTGGLTAAAKVGSTAIGSRNLARIMTDADGRAALLKLNTLPEGSAQARQIAAWLAANYGAEQP